jgi:fructokinase
MNTGIAGNGPRLVAFGEVLWDVFSDRTDIGGASFNVAAHGVRCGLRADILTRVGSDELGRKAVAEIRRLGVGDALAQVDDRHKTGTVTVTLSDTGQPAYVIHQDVAWDFIEANDALLARLDPATVDVFYFGTLAQRHAVSRGSLGRILKRLEGVRVFFDVNLRQSYFSQEIVEEGLRRATIVKLNDHEACQLSMLLWKELLDEHEFARRVLREYPVRLVLITQAERGCLVAEGRAITHCPGVHVTVADAVGAGDAFSAAFLAGFLKGMPAVDAAVRANRVGAFVASRRGAIPEYDQDFVD